MKYEHKNIVMDTESYEVYKDDKEIHLPISEFNILKYLLHNKGKVKTRQHIRYYALDDFGDKNSNIVDVYISYLREKLGKDFIKTVRYVGYKIK